MHSIQKKQHCFFIELAGDIYYDEIEDVIAELYALDDLKDINTLWNFEKCTVHLEYEQLYDLEKTIAVKYPKDGTREKVAFVTSSDFTTALAEIFAEQAESLPFRLKIFEKMHAAEQWLTE